jgi:hypothetical protein
MLLGENESRKMLGKMEFFVCRVKPKTSASPYVGPHEGSGALLIVKTYDDNFFSPVILDRYLMGIKREKENKLCFILKNGTLIVTNNFCFKMPYKEWKKKYSRRSSPISLEK